MGQRQGETGAEEQEAGPGRQPRAAEGAGSGGVMFRVSARAPHGVGALLLIGGAALAGAAAVAWRHARRRGKRDQQPAKREEVSDGGVAEEAKAGASAPEIDRPDDKVLQGSASPREIDRPDDNIRAEEEKTKIASNGLDNVEVTEEIQEVHNDAEIVADESFQSSEQVQEIGLDSGKSSTEIPMHDDEDSEHVEKSDQDSSTELPEITTHDTDSVTAEKGDENSMKNDTESDHNPSENDIENGQDLTTNHMENDIPSKDELKKETAQIGNEAVEASDECSHSMSRPGITLDEQSLHCGDGAQEAESMENSPTAQLMVHPEQLLDDMAMDTEGETGEAEPGKGALVLDRDVHRQKATAEPAGLACSPAPPSLAKPAEKKEPELPLPGWIETGMKVEQDYTDGELKRHGLISRGGATPGGGAVVAVDRRSSSLAVLALMLALAIGITIVVRLYAPPRATKLQIGLQ